MPWQRLVADVGGELVEDPATGLLIPAYRDVVVTVPRQSGKTTLILGWEIQRANGWLHLGPQRIVYSAQTGTDARKKLIEDQVPILNPRKTKLGIRRILKGMGNEAVEFLSGSRLVLMASGEEAGHGKTVDLGVKDEFFADVDDRRDQALGPAMITRAAAQKLTASTMGTDASVPLNQLVDRGRRAVRTGERTGIAYFEWSADPEEDPDDPEVWWRCMPALGITMTEDAVRHERDVTFAGKPGEFRRAYLNIATRSDERLIPATTWDLVNSPDAKPSDDMTFGIDMNPERSAAAIVVVGGGVLEVIDHRPGVGWLSARARELDDRWGEPFWAVDGRASAPIASVIPELKREGLTVVEIDGPDLTAACGAFYDRVIDRTITVRRHPSLDAAVEGADRRFVGDAWTWDRRNSSVDISPLVAATVAAWVDSEMTAPNIF
jgi:phage terminase large subunit-like protein